MTPHGVLLLGYWSEQFAHLVNTLLFWWFSQDTTVPLSPHQTLSGTPPHQLLGGVPEIVDLVQVLIRRIQGST